MTADGNVDRARLGRIVFADERARRDLEAIVHPAVYRAIEAGFRGFELIDRPAFAVADIPLLYETGRQGLFDRVVATVCEPEEQRARLAARGLSAGEIEQRLAAQMPAADKAARADFVIRTDGDFASTDRQVLEIVNELSASSRQA
jgi:dephospho-CoA kinase